MTNHFRLKKSLTMLISTAILTCSLSACGCDHEWKPATCTEPETCTLCGEIGNSATGHDCEEATCTEPKTCKTCGETEGKALRHNYEHATCLTPRTCSVCGKTQGVALGHDYSDGICVLCGYEDPTYFFAGKYGFINTYDKYTWIQITKYKTAQQITYATFLNYKNNQKTYRFKDGVRYEYTNYFAETLQSTTNYTIINNDAILIEDKTFTIYNRVYDDKGNLILKTMCDTDEMWFVLKEQIDWERSPKIESGPDFTDYTYYFN